MDIYNTKLRQRVERKKVIFEHNLLEYRKNAGLDKKRSKDERDLLQKAKPFARMMNRVDFEEFDKGLVEEQHLRHAIAQLQDWRYVLDYFILLFLFSTPKYITETFGKFWVFYFIFHGQTYSINCKHKKNLECTVLTQQSDKFELPT